MSAALIRTEMGLQVRDGADRSAHADREHRQPNVRPTGRNRFAAAVTEPDVEIVPNRKPEAGDRKLGLPGHPTWDSTFVTATEAAHYLGYADFRELRKYVAAGLLTPHYRAISNRAIYLRVEVERLVKPRAA